MWQILAPQQLHNLLLVAIGVQLFTYVTQWLPLVDVDLAGALSYGWDNTKLFHDAKIISKLIWSVYVGAIVGHFFMPSILVVVLSWSIISMTILLPGEYCGATLRHFFVASLSRTLTLLDWKSPTMLADVVVGDVLTSYAKVFAEWDALLFCYLMRPADGLCIPSILSVLLVCYPSLCRLRQCIADYRSYHSMRSLLNAFKYGTSFPVVYVAFLLLNPQTHTRWRAIWLVLVSVNTTASIIWDIFVDWDLGYFRTIPGKTTRTWGLRPNLLIWTNTLFYRAAIAFDIFARCSWMVRVISSAYLTKHPITVFLDSGNALFVFQLIEIVRRFVWLALRIESHQVQSIPTHLRT